MQMYTLNVISYAYKFFFYTCGGGKNMRLELYDNTRMGLSMILEVPFYIY